MTQEDKELLLKDLCARLPYKVKVLMDFERQFDGGSICTLTSIKLEETPIFNVDVTLHDCNIEELRPFLRSMSSMTEEEMDTLFDILQIDKDGKDEDWIKINDVCGIKFFFPTGKWVEDVADAYDYLYSIHIDFRGLIRKELAIPVTKENNPYKTLKA